jgi:serine/threonine protein kinase
MMAGRMIGTPPPLPKGTTMGGRFDLLEVLGRGGFGIVYLAHDRLRGDRAVVKELAPAGTLRLDDGTLSFESVGPEAAQRLRQRFLEEIQLLSRLDVPGLVPLRASFGERGSAYYASEFVEGAATLEEILQREGKLHAEGALDILFQLMDTLEALHTAGYLHRDIKPTNILVDIRGKAYLIDFGAAREWHADLTLEHTVLFTEGYAPLEQMSERSRRSPATDIYSLCATAYRMLSGRRPPSAVDRAEGQVLAPLSLLRPEIDPIVARALECGLNLRSVERPQTVEELRSLLCSETIPEGPITLEDFDNRLVKLRRLRFQRRECPGCGGVLEDRRPLRRGVCPVCRLGTVRRRPISDRLCPSCRNGTLHRRANGQPLSLCPCCTTGELEAKRAGLLSSGLSLTCGNCGARFAGDGAGMTLESAPAGREHLSGQSLSYGRWREMSGRTDDFWGCDGCIAQFDVLPDGRWRHVQADPHAAYSALYPEEWARVAAHLDPGAGNAWCDACGADCFVDRDTITVLGAEEDPYGFSARHLGRLLNLQDAAWLGVGKESGRSGLLCGDCGTEFDRDGEYLRLFRSVQSLLRPRTGEAFLLEDWHRIARGLPHLGAEGEFESAFDDAIVAAYVSGELAFGLEEDILWKGGAVREWEGGLETVKSTLIVRRGSLLFGGLLKKWKVPLDALTGVRTAGGRLVLDLKGEESPTIFDVEEVEMRVTLASGTRKVLLGAQHLAARIRIELDRR